MFISISPGHGLLLKLPFADGGFPKVPRPYLVIDSSITNLYLLNVSSINKKEWKLSLPSNKSIKKFNPPFKRPSFVKMDYVYQVPHQDFIYSYLLDEGQKLHTDTLENILKALQEYEGKKIHKINESEIFHLNTN